jgi:hypothetical protein
MKQTFKDLFQAPETATQGEAGHRRAAK